MHLPAADQGEEGRRIARRVQHHLPRRRRQEGREEAGEFLARRAGEQAGVGSGLVGGDPAQRGEMRVQKRFEGQFAPAGQRVERRQCLGKALRQIACRAHRTGAERAQHRMQPRALGLEGNQHAVERGQQRRGPCGQPGAAQHGDLHGPGGGAGRHPRQAEGGQRMLEQGEQRVGPPAGDGGLHHQPGEQRRRARLQRLARRILHGKAESLQFQADAAGEIPVGGDQRGGAAGRLNGLAQGDRNGERLLGRRAGHQQRQAVGGALPGGLIEGGGEGRPAVGGLGRPHGLGQDAAAGGGGRIFLAQHGDVAAVEADHAKKMGKGRLRMAGDAGADRRGDQAEARVVEIGVEARQHHGALRQARDRGQQPGGGRDRAGRAGGDDRAGRPGGQPVDQPLGEAATPLHRLDQAAFGEKRRPGGGGDVEEGQRQLPVGGVVVGHETGEAPPVHLLGRRLVHQGEQIAGEVDRVGRRGGNADRHPVRRQFALRGEPGAPAGHQPGHRQQPVGLADHRRQVEVGQVHRKGVAVLVDVADRPDSRKKRGLAAERVEEDAAQHPGGAPGRHQQGDGGERQRIAVVGKPRHQPSGQKRVDEGRQEGHAGRDGDDARRLSRRIACPDAVPGRAHDALTPRWRRSSPPPRRSTAACRHAARCRPCAGRRAAGRRSPGRTGG
ncbi:hypothetical protein A6302_03346 [Methylobrevis pamukkalensis]|uniref:Uncharacterized protein n=1 Tax=Methylobrevis pamukkalensis TaxID=1439726 RepID=A0A1E3GZA4_9HYPH|nr:hypothetical protein A6302_03346 [Methylobrevis pamukkalensis]